MSDSQDLNKLGINAGQTMNIEVGEDQRYQTQLLGFYPGKSVLIATPMLAGDRPLLLRKDQALIVRFFAQRVACAFKAKVRHLCTTPFHYIHLSYPGKVEVGEIRKAARVMANVQVSVLNKSQPELDKISGAIVDISTVGAKLETMVDIAKSGDVLMLTAMVSIGRIKRLVNWDVEVKTTLDRYDLENSSAAYGVEFHYLNDLDYLALHGYVNGQIAKGAEL